MPHEVQGVRAEVTVTESSVARLSSRRSRPFLSYISRNTFPESNMPIYWSATVVLSISPVATVDDTVEMRPRAKRVNSLVMPAVMPPAVIVAPKHMAQSISHTVESIPSIPLVATSSSSIASEVFIAVPPYTACMAPLNMSPSAISATTFGWNISANTTPINVEANIVTNAGNFLTIIIAVAAGTIISHRLMSYLPMIASWQAAKCAVSVAVCAHPATKNISSAIENEGIVVIIIYRICEKRLTWHTLEANTVVSDNGD